jgi:ligand-binding sensor domain-containing protein
MDKEQFLKTKKKVLKKYPNAKTMMDKNGKYYVATEDGRDICNIQISQTVNKYQFNQTEGYNEGLDSFNSKLNKIATIPHADSVMKAWLQTEIAIRSNHIVNRNNGKFSDEKIMKKILEDE